MNKEKMNFVEEQKNKVSIIYFSKIINLNKEAQEKLKENDIVGSIKKVNEMTAEFDKIVSDTIMAVNDIFQDFTHDDMIMVDGIELGLKMTTFNKMLNKINPIIEKPISDYEGKNNDK